MVKNTSIRKKAKSCGICLWQIAAAYGISDGNFSRKLRQELSTEDQEKIMRIIDQLAQEKQGVV